MTSIAQLTPNLQEAINMVNNYPALNELFNKPDIVATLQENLTESSAWRRFTSVEEVIPRANTFRELVEIYTANYCSPRLFYTRDDWLNLTLQLRDYETLEYIVLNEKLNKKDLKKVRSCFPCYPLYLFKKIWLKVGKVKDFLRILNFEDFFVVHKEDRLLSLLDHVTIANEELIRTALRTAPKVFAYLYKKFPSRVLEEEIQIGMEATGLELQVLETSIRGVLPRKQAEQTLSELALQLLKMRLQTKGVSSKHRDIALTFAATFLSEELIEEIKTWKNNDNALWINKRFP